MPASKKAPPHEADGFAALRRKWARDDMNPDTPGKKAPAHTADGFAAQKAETPAGHCAACGKRIDGPAAVEPNSGRTVHFECLRD